MTLFGFMAGITNGDFLRKYGHIPCLCVCVQLITGLYMFNQIKQYYHVRFRITLLRSHVNSLMWTRRFKEARDDSNE